MSVPVVRETVIGAAILVGGAYVVHKGIEYFKEHTSNKRQSTHDKHTRRRLGRQSEKKKGKSDWFSKGNKRRRR